MLKIGVGLASGFLLGAALSVASAAAEQAPQLFKIVTVKDEIVVAIAPESGIAAPGGTAAIAEALAKKGSLTLWQYAVRKGKDGSLEQAPLRKVSVLGHDSLRVEPYATPLKIIAAE